MYPQNFDQPTQKLEHLKKSKYEQKKKRIFDRLRSATVAATLAVLYAYQPANADASTSGMVNTFNYKDNSPLQNAYELVDQNYTEETPQSRLARLFNTRMEQNNVGNIATDTEINEVAKKQAAKVIDRVEEIVGDTPTWEDVQNYQGDDVTARYLANLESQIGAKGLAGHTQDAFSSKASEQKIATHDTLVTEAQDKGWVKSDQVVDVQDITPELQSTANFEVPEESLLTQEELEGVKGKVADVVNTPQRNTPGELPKQVLDQSLITQKELQNAVGSSPDQDVNTLIEQPTPEIDTNKTGNLQFVGPDGKPLTSNTIVPGNNTNQTMEDKVTTNNGLFTYEKPQWIENFTEMFSYDADVAKRNIKRAGWLGLLGGVGAGGVALWKRKAKGINLNQSRRRNNRRSPFENIGYTRTFTNQNSGRRQSLLERTWRNIFNK